MRVLWDGAIVNQFRALALETLLLKMFNTKRHFCVCDFDTLLQLGGIEISRDERAPFAALHCVDYADMPKGLKEKLATEVVTILRRTPAWKLEVKAVFAPALTVETGRLLL